MADGGYNRKNRVDLCETKAGSGRVKQRECYAMGWSKTRKMLQAQRIKPTGRG